MKINLNVKTVYCLIAMIFMAESVVVSSKPDKMLRWLVSPQYQIAFRYSDHYGLAKNNDTFYLIDRKGRSRKLENFRQSVNPEGCNDIEIALDSSFAAEGVLALVSKKDNKCHYILTSDLTEIPGAWDDAGPFSEGKAVVRNGEISYVIEPSGKILFKLPDYDEFGRKYQEGMLRAKSGEKWGFIDSDGKWAIFAKYVGCWNFSKGIAWVLDNDRWLAIRKDGSVIYNISAENGEISWARGSKALIERKVDWSLYDAFHGKLFTVKGIVQTIIEMNAPFCTAEEGGPWYFINENGGEMSKHKYKNAQPFYNGFAVISEGGKYGVINNKGKLVVPFVLDGAGIAAEGIIPATIEGKSGYLKIK